MTELSAAVTDYWDAAAPGFDERPDHGLSAREARAAWAVLVRRLLAARPEGDGDGGPPPADMPHRAPEMPGTLEVLDAGCGTGTMSLLLAEAGHRVTGVDISPRMVELARAKLAAAGLPARFLVGDAAAPPTGERRFDVLLCRHVLWTLPDPAAALREWAARLRPGGRMLFFEGRRWYSGRERPPAPYVTGAERLPWPGGIGPEELAGLVRPFARPLRAEPLTDPSLWGGAAPGERHALVAVVPG
ncbi:class I SAM-dependent methyltransferase [Streptomyces aidingensis]|uniref:Methyltransferase domain-containing protein n=1 Tax=Streptomyces aidingensis TaxID=910347 RepID=A0A1I1Q5F5_9ACTN|nr:class I SAM-dependent methyltransferase [Streptomyces aidingensis]SFD15078.1 Methyltransferase domain-containing protein [Streptomyces aidingensis]